MTPLWSWLAFSVALAGPVDRSSQLQDAAGTPRADGAAHKAAHIGAVLPKKPIRRVAPRAAAWRSVGRLGVLDDAVLADARTALLAPTNAPAVRASAAWALGELSRGRAWADAKPVALLLQEAMTAPLDAEAAYAVVEAFGKAYPPHEHSFDEDLAASRALNTLAANQTTQMPSIYYVVLDRVLTIEVAIRLLRDEIQEARTSRNEQNLAEAYNAVLTTVRWLGSRQEQLVNGFGEQKTTIGAAFDALLGALDLEDRRMTLMLMWSLGNVSTEPVFADLVGERASVVVRQTDPLVRMITAWSLSRLMASPAARTATREGILGTEADSRVLEMLGAIRAHSDAPDLVQKLYQVETQKGEGK